MAQKTDAALLTQKDEIKSETTANANTATRVGQMFEDVIDSKSNNSLVIAADTTGTAISFAVPQIYGSVASPETGNITVVTTGLVKGMTQLLIHNNGSEPTYGAEIQIISGEYTTGVDNYIMLMAVSTTLILATISQELV